MKTPATVPFAALLGLPPRAKAKGTAKPKARDRERRTAATTRTARSAIMRREVHKVARMDAPAAHKKSFAELLDVATSKARPVKHRHVAVIADAPVSQPEPLLRRDALTPAARRIIALGAEARGESLAPDGIDAQLRRARDEACGITPAARKIIDRAVQRQASKPRTLPDASAIAGATRD